MSQNNPTDEIIDKIMDYIQDKVSVSDFDYSEKLRTFIIWFNINPEKVFFILSKLEPVIFEEKITNQKDNEKITWSDLVSTILLDCKSSKIMFQIALFDVSYQIFLKAKDVDYGEDD